MENASKALIIAGAILLSILIIAIGMYIYNSSQNSIATAESQISAQEIESFNKTWEMYEGVQTGTNVRSLISKMSANAAANATEETKLPDLCYQPSAGFEEKKWLPRVVSTVKKPQGEFVHAATGTVRDFNRARSQIEPNHQYSVYLIQSSSTSLVSGIVVAYSSVDNLKEFFDDCSTSKAYNELIK